MKTTTLFNILNTACALLVILTAAFIPAKYAAFFIVPSAFAWGFVKVCENFTKLNEERRK